MNRILHWGTNFDPHLLGICGLTKTQKINDADKIQHIVLHLPMDPDVDVVTLTELAPDFCSPCAAIRYRNSKAGKGREIVVYDGAGNELYRQFVNTVSITSDHTTNGALVSVTVKGNVD